MFPQVRVGNFRVARQREDQMIHVRRHKRQTASGKTVTVTAHEREGGSGSRGEVVRPAPEWSQPEYVGDIQPAPTAQPADGDWWADNEQAARDSVTYGPPVDKSDIGAWIAEISARDEAAQDKRKTREEARRLKGEQIEAMARFSNAPTRAERDAAGDDFKRISAELRALTGKGGFADWGHR